MRRNILIALNSIYLLLAGLVVGVPLGIGAIVAPVLFHQPGVERPFAGAVMGRAFEGSGMLCVLALSIMLAVAAFEITYRKRTNTKRLLMARLGMNLAALLVNVYLTESMLPMMKDRQRLGDHQTFLGLHATYQSLTWVSIALGVGLIVITQAVNIGPRRDGGHSRQV